MKQPSTLSNAMLALLLYFIPTLASLDKPVQASINGAQTRLNPDLQKLERYASSLAGKTIDNVDVFLNKLLAPAHTDRDKAWLIYSWATRHFQYDSRVPARLNSTSNQELERLFNQRRGSCAVYAHATTQLLQKAGLNAQTVVGKGLTSAGSTGHVWTQVQIDGQWLTVDSTWGAGYMGENGFVAEPNADFFLMPAQHSVLLYHDPKDRLGTQRELGIGATQFNRLPDSALTLIQLGFKSEEVLQTAKQGTALADTFDQPAGTFTVEHAPLTRQLLANKAVNFQLKTRHYLELAVVQNEEWQTMQAIKTPEGLQYTLRTTPKRGDLMLVGRKAGSQNFEALLAYVVQ